MKINKKINLHIVIIVTATLIFTFFMQLLKSQELDYYNLVEQVKSMNAHVLKALVEEKKISVTDSNGGSVYIFLDKASNSLKNIDPDLLGKKKANLQKISDLIKQFQSSFRKRIGNNILVMDKKKELLSAANGFFNIYKLISKKMDKEIADSQLYNWDKFDTTKLLELKRSSSYANNLIGELILLMGQELFLEENINAFARKYDQAIFALGIQEENLRLQIKLLKGTDYNNVSKQLTTAYSKIELLTPDLKNLFIESLEISGQLDAIEMIISKHTEQLIFLSEALRQEKNKTASILLIIGLAVFFISFLIGGVMFSRSITRPLSALVYATNSIQNDSPENKTQSAMVSLKQTIDLAQSDEISVLANSFINMENEIHDKIALIKQSEKNLEITLNSIGDAVIATDLSGRIIRMNPMAEHLTAWNESEAKGIPLAEVFNIIDAKTEQTAGNPVEKVLAHGRIVNIANHTKLIARDGRQRQIADSGAPIKNKDGKIIGVVLVFRDVTKEYQMRKAQRESEARYQRLFTDSIDPIFITSREGKIIEANPATTALLGYSAEEFNEINITQIYKIPEERNKFIREIEDKGEVKDFKMELIGKKGEALFCLMNATLKYSNKGEISGYQGILRDVTNQRRLELQVQQGQKMESIGTLAGGIAHDFNNILSAIIGYAELGYGLLPDEGPLKGYQQKVIKAGHRAADLVNQILTFSRQDEHEKKPLLVHLVVKEALKLLRASIPSTIEIRESINTKRGSVLADPTHIHQIVMNLCTNSYHAMRETGGILAVELDDIEIKKEDHKVKDLSLAPGAFVLLKISDTGCGMTRATLDRIFEPYFTTKKKGEGTGMGLAMVHGIVKRQGGHISVYSEPGQGTSILVYMPRIQTAVIDSEIKEKNEIQGGDEKILLVDDDESVLQMEKDMLIHLGYKMTCATSGQQALEVFHLQPENFDLVITDMTMPHMTGAELSQEILNIRPDIPIIMCSGFSELITKDKAKAIGIKEYIMKPIVRNNMAKVIRKALDGPHLL